LYSIKISVIKKKQQQQHENPCVCYGNNPFCHIGHAISMHVITVFRVEEDLFLIAIRRETRITR